MTSTTRMGKARRGPPDTYELLVSFMVDNGFEYGPLTFPLDPFFVVAKMQGSGEGIVVEGEEYR